MPPNAPPRKRAASTWGSSDGDGCSKHGDRVC
jgi:hypothetical protein